MFLQSHNSALTFNAPQAGLFGKEARRVFVAEKEASKAVETADTSIKALEELKKLPNLKERQAAIKKIPEIDINKILDAKIRGRISNKNEQEVKGKTNGQVFVEDINDTDPKLKRIAIDLFTQFPDLVLTSGRRSNENNNSLSTAEYDVNQNSGHKSGLKFDFRAPTASNENQVLKQVAAYLKTNYNTDIKTLVHTSTNDSGPQHIDVGLQVTNDEKIFANFLFAKEKNTDISLSEKIAKLQMPEIQTAIELLSSSEKTRILKNIQIAQQTGETNKNKIITNITNTVKEAQNSIPANLIPSYIKNPSLLIAMAGIESDWTAKATNNTSTAGGMLQILRDTHTTIKGLQGNQYIELENNGNLNNPEYATKAAINYLIYLDSEFKNNKEHGTKYTKLPDEQKQAMLAAAYFSGPGSAYFSDVSPQTPQHKNQQDSFTHAAKIMLLMAGIDGDKFNPKKEGTNFKIERKLYIKSREEIKAVVVLKLAEYHDKNDEIQLNKFISTLALGLKKKGNQVGDLTKENIAAKINELEKTHNDPEIKKAYETLSEQNFNIADFLEKIETNFKTLIQSTDLTKPGNINNIKTALETIQKSGLKNEKQKAIIDRLLANINAIQAQQVTVNEQNTILTKIGLPFDTALNIRISEAEIRLAQSTKMQNSWMSYIPGKLQEWSAESFLDSAQSTIEYKAKVYNVLQKTAAFILARETSIEENGVTGLDSTADIVTKTSKDLFPTLNSIFIKDIFKTEGDLTNALTAIVDKTRANSIIFNNQAAYGNNLKENLTTAQNFTSNEVETRTNGIPLAKLEEYEAIKNVDFTKKLNTKFIQSLSDKESPFINSALSQLKGSLQEHWDFDLKNKNAIEGQAQAMIDSCNKVSFSETWKNMDGNLKLLAGVLAIVGIFKFPKTMFGVGAMAVFLPVLSGKKDLGAAIDHYTKSLGGGVNALSTTFGLSDRSKWNDFPEVMQPNQNEHAAIDFVEAENLEDLNNKILTKYTNLEEFNKLEKGSNLYNALTKFKDGIGNNNITTEDLGSAIYKLLRMRAMNSGSEKVEDGRDALQGFLENTRGNGTTHRASISIGTWILIEVTPPKPGKVIEMAALVEKYGKEGAIWLRDHPGAAIADFAVATGTLLASELKVKDGEGNYTDYFWKDLDFSKTEDIKDVIGAIWGKEGDKNGLRNARLTLQSGVVLETADDALDYLGLFSADVWETKETKDGKDKLTTLNLEQEEKYKEHVKDILHILHPLQKGLNFAEEDFPIGFAETNGEHGEMQDNRAMGMFGKTIQGAKWEVFQMLKNNDTSGIEKYKNELKKSVVETIITIADGKQGFLDKIINFFQSDASKLEEANKFIAAFKNTSDLDKQYDLIEEFEQSLFHSSFIFDLVNITTESNEILLDQINILGTPERIKADLKEFAKQMADSMKLGRRERDWEEIPAFDNMKIDLWGQNESVGGGQFFGQAVFLYQEFLSTAQNASPEQYDAYKTYLENRIAAELHGTGLIETPTRLDIKQLRRELEYFDGDWRNQETKEVKKIPTQNKSSININIGSINENTAPDITIPATAHTSNDHTSTINQENPLGIPNADPQSKTPKFNINTISSVDNNDTNTTTPTDGNLTDINNSDTNTSAETNSTTVLAPVTQEVVKQETVNVKGLPEFKKFSTEKQIAAINTAEKDGKQTDMISILGQLESKELKELMQDAAGQEAVWNLVTEKTENNKVKTLNNLGDLGDKLYFYNFNTFLKAQYPAKDFKSFKIDQSKSKGKSFTYAAMFQTNTGRPYFRPNSTIEAIPKQEQQVIQTVKTATSEDKNTSTVASNTTNATTTL